jgi:hypothetical protein
MPVCKDGVRLNGSVFVFAEAAMRSFPVILGFSLLFMTACGAGNDAESDDTKVPEESAAAEPQPAPSEPAPTEPETAREPDKDSSLHRPAEITLEITGREQYAGTYKAAGTSRTCGPQLSMMGEPSDRFAVEFPYEGDFDVVDLSFQAETLRPGQNTDRFNMSVSVRTASGGRPPSFVVRAGRGESGSASLVREGDTYRLSAKGENSQGTFTLVVTCQPRAN